MGDASTLGCVYGVKFPHVLLGVCCILVAHVAWFRLLESVPASSESASRSPKNETTMELCGALPALCECESGNYHAR